MSIEPKVKRWFCTHHLHSHNFSVWETDSYGPNQGFATEQEALADGIKRINKDLSSLSSGITNASNDIVKLTDEQSKLIKRLREIT